MDGIGPDQNMPMLSSLNMTLEGLLTTSGLSTNSSWFSSEAEKGLMVGFCLTIVLGLFGNGLVAVVLCRRHSLRSARHGYVMNLVISDILTCLLCLPFTMLRLLFKDWQLGELLCRTGPTLQITYVFVSILTTLAIAAERYRAIVCSSASSRSSNPRFAPWLIPAIWLLALTLASPLAITHRLEYVRSWSDSEHILLTVCIEHWDSETWLGVYTVFLLLFQYALPAFAIVALHILICRFLRKRVQLRQDSFKANQRKMKRHRKNLILLSVISITFAVEWLPITILNIIADFDYTVFSSVNDFYLIYALSLLIALSSVVVNPVVYGWFNPNVQRSLCLWFGCQNRESGTPSSRMDNSEMTSQPVGNPGNSTTC